MRKAPLRSDPESNRKFVERGRVSSALSLERSRRARGGISPASEEQRIAAVTIGFCIGCGREPTPWRKLTPAHVVPRDLGGCEHRLCTLPLCVTPDGGCHPLYDEGKLDLLKLIVRPDRWPTCKPAFVHALDHLLPVPLLEQLAGDEVLWKSVLLEHQRARELGL